MKVIFVAVILTMFGCSDGLGFFREMIKPARRVTQEWCEQYTDKYMTCGLGVNKRCSCAFLPDEMDKANEMYNAAVAKMASDMAIAEKAFPAEEEETEEVESTEENDE